MGTNRRGRKFKEVIFFLSENIDNTHAAALFFYRLYMENQITSENVHTLWDSRNNTQLESEDLFLNSNLFL